MFAFNAKKQNQQESTLKQTYVRVLQLCANIHQTKPLLLTLFQKLKTAQST